MDRWRGKVAVVTGASSGIGLAVAKTLFREGMIVIGLARRRQKMLDEMKDNDGSGKFFARECDVTKEKDVLDAFDYVKDTFGTVHVLINNAGMIKIKTIEDAETSELEEIINVNVMGLLYCSKHAIKLMKSNDHEAHIINMNSVAGLKVPNANWLNGETPALNVYAPTKFAVTALSEVFAVELRDGKIRVTNLSPGYVNTGIVPEAEKQNTAMIKLPFLLVDDVADAVVFILGTKPHVQVTQLTLKVLGEPF